MHKKVYAKMFTAILFALVIHSEKRELNRKLVK